MSNNKKGPSEIQFTFMVKSSRMLSDGMSPIVFRVIYRAQRKDVLTGITCPPELWMKSEKIVNHCYPPAKEINPQLQKILFNAETSFQKLKFQGDEFSIDELINQLKGKIAPLQNIADYVLMKMQ